MRVIAGSMKGHALKVPRSSSTRPMSQRIREALFSVLDSREIYPYRVLDLYAGSGGIGIEALSRGAAWCDFVERNGAACRVIRDNLRSTRFDERAKVHQAEVGRFLERVNQPYDLVTLDPPYADPGIVEMLRRLEQSSAVESGSAVALGHWPRLDTPARIGRLALLRERCHGDSCFAVYVVQTPETGFASEELVVTHGGHGEV